MTVLRVRQLATSLSKNALASPSRSGARRASSTTAVVVVAAALPKNFARAAATAGLSGAGAAHADETAVVDSAVATIVDVVKATGDAVKSGLSVAESGFEQAKSVYETIAPSLKTATDTVTPAISSAVKAATPVVQAGVRAAGEAASSVRPTLERALSESGVDAKSVAGAGEQAVATAKPLFESLVTFITTSPPTILAETAVGLVAAYYLLPPVLKASVGLLRGYAGDVSPPAALDALATQGNAVMVDIRSARDKEQSGIPDLPNSGKLVELEYASIDDRKLRGQLRDIQGLEMKITAMQVAALKRLSKGAHLYLMDKNGGVAKAVARELAGRGFGKVFVINGGFSGWQRDRLGTKLGASVSRVEVLLPGGSSSSFGRGGGGGGSVSSSSTRQMLPVQQTRRALPSGSSASR